MRATRIVFLLGEIGYIAAVRILLDRSQGLGVALELKWSALRLASLLVLAWLFRRVRREMPRPPARMTAAGWLAAGVILVPIFTGDEGMPSPLRYLFAATSLLVALREELAYRAIFQRLLTERFGFPLALATTTLAFIGYHYGIQPFSFPHVAELVFCGLIFGVAYHVTHSLALVVVLHAVYDAIWPFTPVVPWRLPDHAGAAIFLITLGAMLIANRRAPRTALP